MGTFDSATALSLPLSTLVRMLSDHGATHIYAKNLAANDNSKNQIYCSGHLTDLSFLKPISVNPTPSASLKTKDPKRKVKFIAPLDFAWLTPEGGLVQAPNAKLIYYPQYPEVRLSGFLLGASGIQASQWMDRYARGTEEGRWLILGVREDKKVIAYLVTPESSLSTELNSAGFIDTSSVFNQIDAENSQGSRSSRELLIDALRSIYQKGFVPSQKLSTRTGLPEPYRAQNGGGYTLEALLGIPPNGDAVPDYLGWEVKQFGVTRFPCVSPKVTTLLTPEPDGGVYVESGLADFMRLYGYPPVNGVLNRLNFGGIHVLNSICDKTGLELRFEGYDYAHNTISDSEGFVGLFDSNGCIAASWSFAKLLEHWQRKHAQAVYVPCLKVTDPQLGVGYQYGGEVELGVGTTFEKMLTGFTSSHIYYDPGINVKNLDTNQPKSKKRSQFRIKHQHLSSLYEQYSLVSLDS